MKLNYLFLVAISVACINLITAAAPAGVISLNPAKDATLVESVDGTLANGAGDAIFTGRTLQGEGLEFRRALIQFDVTSIDQATTVNAVTLSLFLIKNNVGSAHTLHKVTADWSEGPTLGAGSDGGQGGIAVAGDATWKHRVYDTVNWATEGGDFVSTPSAMQTVGSSGAAYEWTSEQMLDDVKEWISNPDQNFGWILIGDEELVGGAQKFYSREGAIQPVLTIDVSVPITTNLWTIY